MTPPTARQLELLEHFAEFQHEHGFPPTTRELCARTETHYLDVYEKLCRLERHGCIERTSPPGNGKRGQSRAWLMTDHGHLILGLPASRVISPVESTERATGTVDLGSRCPDCGVQLFGGLTHCLEHRSAA